MLIFNKSSDSSPVLTAPFVETTISPDSVEKGQIFLFPFTYFSMWVVEVGFLSEFAFHLLAVLLSEVGSWLKSSLVLFMFM